MAPRDERNDLKSFSTSSAALVPSSENQKSEASVMLRVLFATSDLIITQRPLLYTLPSYIPATVNSTFLLLYSTVTVSPFFLLIAFEILVVRNNSLSSDAAKLARSS